MEKKFKISFKRVCQYSTLMAPFPVIVGLLASTPAMAATTILLSPLEPPQAEINTDVFAPWAKQVAKVTDNQVIIKFLPMNVAPPNQLDEAVRSDIIDAAYFYNGLLPNRFPLVQIGGLPFLSVSSEQNSIALWNTYEKYFAGHGEYKQLKLLALYCAPPEQLFSENKEFSSLSDLRDKKILSLPGPVQMLLSDSGIAVQASPAVQMSEFITSGTIDGVAGTDPLALEDFKLAPYMKSVTYFPEGLSTACFSFVINKAKWDAIPAKYQAAIEQTTGLSFAKRQSVIDDLAKKDLELEESSGIKLVHPAPDLMAAFKKSAQMQYTKWIKIADQNGVDGKAALAYYESQLKLNGNN